MQLTPNTGPGWIELVATKIADGLIVAGQRLHARWAVLPDELPAGELEIRLEQWRSSMQAFILHGDRLSFSQRKLEETGVCRRKAYDAYMLVLKKSGVLIVYPRSGSYWAYSWNRRKLAVMIRRRLIELPYPTDRDPPPLFVGRAADAQLAQHTQTTQVSTVWAKTAPGPSDSGASKEK